MRDIRAARALLPLAGIVLCLVGTGAGAGSGSGDGQAGASGLLLVANKGDRSLSVIDPVSGRQLAAVPVGGTTGHEVAASPDGRTAWVPVYGDSGVGRPGTDGHLISIIDLGTHTRIAAMDLGKPSRPHSAVFNPRDGRLYITSELTRSILVIDPGTRQVVGSIPTGAPESHMLAISSDGRLGYTSNVGAGSVSALDLGARKLRTVIPVARTVQRIAISGDDRWVFTTDQAAPRVAVIDTATDTVRRWIPLPARGFGLAATRDGGRLLVTEPSANTVSIVDLRSMQVAQSIRVPSSPQEILISPDGRVAYVSCDLSRQVARIDLSTGKVERLLDAGGGADGLAWAAR